MADAFENQMQDPNADLSSFVEQVTEIVEAEWPLRSRVTAVPLKRNLHVHFSVEIIDAFFKSEKND